MAGELPCSSFVANQGTGIPTQDPFLVERGIVCQNVDDVKTDGSRKQMVIAGEIIAALQSWKQTTQREWLPSTTSTLC